MLLAADGQRGYVVQAAGLLGGLLECHQYEGSTDVPFGCLACPNRTSSPVSASVTRTLQDCVDVSTPATRVLAMVCVASLHVPFAGGARLIVR